MKNHIIKITLGLLLFASYKSYAGLDWTYGSLTNANALHRYSQAVSYSSNGNVFVAGIEESASGNRFIVTKKFNASGALLASVTNTYFTPIGATIADWVKSISLDASGNVYVLGSQFGSTARGNDIVVIKYNSSLTFQWKNLLYNTAYPNNNFNDVPCKLFFDGSSNVYVSGTLANESVPDETTIVVRKYNSSGTVIYTGHVGEPANTTVSNATDMCMDASDNVTVTAKAQNVLLGTPSIMCARVNPSGITSWQKFSSIPTNYSLGNDPKIECSTTGIFYLGTSLSREAPANNYYARHMVQKFNNSGTKLWESLTTEINRGANSYMMQLDANENVYSGGDFVAAPGSPFSNYRIYKFNSAGAQLWGYTSPENSAYMRFEKYSTSALFVASQIGNSGPAKLRKFNATNGNVIWTEDISITNPPGYIQSHITLSNLSVNKLTSEVVFCGNIFGQTAAPNSSNEYRWHIRKYGATSPRFATVHHENNSGEINVKVFPNPATDAIYINNLTADENFNINIVDMVGREVYNCSATTTIKIQTSNLKEGMYLLRIENDHGMRTEKIIVKRN
ncbi:MAG TPA: T9SS type A sorting domain-containing protein [Bacteroidia bacterium]|nr:T9SS type A sorting domain-containing protein [Bacteroidia bacterium]HNU32413.1 T9SS type A sorting domain-containing protein [Bacteroidia bacterium]